MFVNNEAFRQILQNCDYFVLFKNPRNSSEIRTLAQQMTPGNLILVQIFMEATKGPFSYLFINLTQECDPKMKYSSDLFDNLGRINVYKVEGQRYRMDIGYGNFEAIAFKNNSKQMMLFIPCQDRTYNQQIYQPRLSNITHIGMPQTNFNDGHVRYELNNVKGLSNIVQNTPKVETVVVNAQTQPMQYAEARTSTNLPSNIFAQTRPMQYSESGINTNLPSVRLAQTQPIHTQSTNTPSQNHISTHNYTCKCEDDVEMDQTGIEYKSDFARRLQKSEVIPNAQPVTNYNSEGPRQTESSTLHHIPNRSIQHPSAISHIQPSTIQSIEPSTITQQALQPPALQYRQTYGIENMETDAIDYQAQQPLQYTQQQAVPYTSQNALHHLPNQQSIQHPSAISHIQHQSLQYNQPYAIAHNQPLALEHTTYICKLCLTKFSTLKRLEKHIERFHAAFGQMDRGIKRGGLLESEEHKKKKSRLVEDEDMEEMYGGKIKGDILNHCYKCKTCGDLVNYREYKWNEDEYNDSDDDRDEYDHQSGDSDDQSEGGYDQSEMSDESEDDANDDSNDDRDEQSGKDDNSDDDDDDERESDLDFGGPKCSECGRSVHVDWG